MTEADKTEGMDLKEVELGGLRDMMLCEIEGIYTTTEARAAYRAGLSTASAVADRLSILVGARTVRAAAQLIALKVCGDQIWQLRELVQVHSEDPSFTRHRYRGGAASENPDSTGGTSDVG